MIEEPNRVSGHEEIEIRDIGEVRKQKTGRKLGKLALSMMQMGPSDSLLVHRSEHEKSNRHTQKRIISAMRYLKTKGYGPFHTTMNQDDGVWVWLDGS
jgi:hypothetical protein